MKRGGRSPPLKNCLPFPSQGKGIKGIGFILCKKALLSLIYLNQFTSKLKEARLRGLGAASWLLSLVGDGNLLQLQLIHFQLDRNGIVTGKTSQAENIARQRH